MNIGPLIFHGGLWTIGFLVGQPVVFICISIGLMMLATAVS